MSPFDSNVGLPVRNGKTVQEAGHEVVLWDAVLYLSRC